MTEAEEIQEHWRRKPTVGALVRAYFGIERPSASEPVDLPDQAPKQVTPEQLERLVADLGRESDKSMGNPFR